MQKVLNFVNKTPKLLTDIRKSKGRWLMLLLRHDLCVDNSVREKSERRLTGGTMMVNEIKSEKVQKNKEE